MPPKKVNEATLYLIDLNTRDKTNMWNCFQKILAKLSLSAQETKNQDVYKLVFAGTPETDNDLNYKNIKVVHDWKLYKKDDFGEYLKRVSKSGMESVSANVFEALYLCAHHLTNDVLVSNFAPKRIVLLSDLYSPPPSNMKQIVSNLCNFLKTADIWLYVLGAKVKIPYLNSFEDVQSWSRIVQPVDKAHTNHCTNLKAIRDLLHEGLVADWEVGLHLQFLYKPQMKPPYPWYATLKIGEDIEIEVNVVKLVSDLHGFRFRELEEVGVEERTIVKNPDTGDIIKDAIAGYKIHGQHIALSAEKEKEQMDREEDNEDKCLDIKFFIPDSYVSALYFEPDSISQVVADTRNSDGYQLTLDVLAESMHQSHVAAVVKRIHARGPQYRPKPHVLFVCPEHGPHCLLMARWPTKQNIDMPDAYNKGPKMESSSSQDQSSGDKMKNAVYSYLESITVHRDDLCDEGRTLHCLSENLCQNPNMMNQCEHLVHELLEPGQFEQQYSEESKDEPERLETVQEFCMHPMLQEKSAASRQLLHELIRQQRASNKDRITFKSLPTDD